MTTHIVTKELINRLLNDTNPAKVQAAIGRALVVLLDRQTSEESATNTTQIHNMRGFTGADAKSGSITAKYWIKHKRLEDWQVAKWTRPNRLAKYWKQLDQEAQRKQLANQAA